MSPRSADPADAVLVAAAQFASPLGAVAANTATAVEMIHEAADRGARLVALPEFCLSGYESDWVAAGAPGAGTPVHGPRLLEIAADADRRGIAVVLGELERAGAALYSTVVLMTGGGITGVHRKTVLTEAEDRAGLRAGDRAAEAVTVPGVPLPVGPMVCFEHGFPEIALDLALGGAGIITISSAIRSGTEYLRNLRTRARAQDNGLYVVASNAVGDSFCGDSMIVDPRGEVIARASATGTEVIFADVQPGLVAEQRRLEPVLRLRRPELRRRP